MDIVDTFNHLIPSDQLDDSLIVGQNLECEANNEFCPGIPLEDSLKNMLSDKDPMFGCASSQFNLLDSEDPAFQIAGLDGGTMSSGLSSEITVAETPPVKRPVGRPRKRPCHVENECAANNASKPDQTDAATVRRRPGRPRKHPIALDNSFMIDKGVTGVKLKQELINGGRVNINDCEGALWLQPNVVLRKLTVTIGGFRIELLPGPGYTQTVNDSFEDGMAYSGDIGFTMLQDATLDIQSHLTDNIAAIDIVKSCVDDATLGLGPYVNPNEVQTANGTLQGTQCEVDAKLDNHAGKQTNDNKQKETAKPQQKVNDKTSNNVEKSPDKPHPYPLKLHKPKQDLASIKNKKMVSGLQHTITKKPKPLQNTQPKLLNRDEKHVTNIVKDKKGIVSLKRPIENAQSGHHNKVQKTQVMADVKVKPKLPTSPTALVKKNSNSGHREQHGPSKPTPPQNKVESMHPTPNRPGQSVKSPEASGPEKIKVKKPEKLVHKQRSRTISVEEPELFIPDNAPVKKESSEELPVANSEAQWDGCNSCGLCKKSHNNMFMVGCGRCDDWFHGDCVGLDLIKVREMEEEDQMYVCLKCCEEESKKAEPEPPGALKAEVKNEVQDPKTSPTKSRAGPSQSVPSGGVPAVRKEPDRRQSVDHKSAFYSKQDVKSKPSSSTKKPVSVEQIRRSVRDSLKEILTQRLKESNLNVSVEKAHEIARKTERELFHLYKDTDSKYKNKYRSLTFNLKDTKNNVLFKKVLKGEISPSNLIRMSPEELASKELAAWRQRENRHTIEMIEKEQREAERRPITKITHKGEIEIESLEPVKAPETVEPVLPPKAPPAPLPEPVVTPENKEEIGPLEKDTTALHKSHLFDLHCKICTGRMAPPVEEAPTKVVKVATTVIRRQSTKAEETKITTTPPPIDDDLHLGVLEESLQSTKSGYSTKLDTSATKDETATFLAGLKSLWRGFLHMASVAKLVTKAFPVSGILDHLTEDLPDSIQIGGRIGPQIVWDYLEKIRATGTKEVCLIRFSPETEEDEISYTLLYAYFSSRKRFGVVSNNLKQVKDMYIIPLGATEKVPHQLVPFDGPGLENNRPNLLLGLIIRQRPKRDYISVESETRPAPEVKHSTVSLKETKSSQEEDEQLYLSSLTRPLRKEKDKPLDTTENAEEEDEPLAFEDPPASEEGNNQGAKKPRFLPGVLLGWGGILPPLPDVFGKSSPSAAGDDSKKTHHQAAKTETSTSGNSLKSPTSVTPRDRFLIKKKDVKPAKVEPEPPKPTDAAKSVPSTDTTVAVIQNSTITLKDKPPDVSTEVFLASLSTDQSSAAKGDVAVVNEVNKTTNAESQNPTTTVDGPKPLSGILKKSSAYSTSANESTNEVLPNDNAQSNKTVCGVAESDPVMSLVSPTPVKVDEQTTKHTSGEDGVLKDDVDYLNPFIVQKLVTEIPLLEPDSRVAESADHHTSDATLPEEPPVSGSYDYPIATAGLSTAESQERNSSATLSSEESSGQSKDYKRIEVRYTDHDRRHHRDSHHGKKSRHHDREREKKYDRNHDDKYRDRSRHHGHSDDRHSEKRKDRHHSEDYRHKDKDRHRHRRDSDYENGRRSSRDSYS